MANNFNDYRREMVLLHIPFRSEDNEVLAENKFIQIYEDNKNLILERRKEFDCNLDLEKTLEICRQLGRDDDNEDEQLRTEANVIFEEEPYARLLQDVNSVVNADIRNATLSKLGAIAKKGKIQWILNNSTT